VIRDHANGHSSSSAGGGAASVACCSLSESNRAGVWQ
jgi:hypothetical protein